MVVVINHHDRSLMHRFHALNLSWLCFANRPINTDAVSYTIDRFSLNDAFTGAALSIRIRKSQPCGATMRGARSGQAAVAARGPETNGAPVRHALLGTALGGDSWLAWRILLIAAMGEALTDEERPIFAKLTAREREPGERVAELWCIIGRRGGANREL
jgi:hypothetical protein